VYVGERERRRRLKDRNRVGDIDKKTVYSV
jgi:hypothetical protein